MKRCSKCGEDKGLADFYRQKAAPCGYRAECKLCTKAYARSYRASERGREAGRQAARRYIATPHGKAARRRYVATDRGRGVRVEANVRHRARYPERALARSIAREARRRGVLVPQPCRDCGAAQVEAHHSDYSRPLDVTWLCRRCHAAEHVAERRIA